MKAMYLLLTTLIILACGAPAYIAPADMPAPTYQQNAETAIHTPIPIRFVSGCWNIRETPAGKVVDAVCNGGLRVYGLVDGWMKIDQGYICPRAFGDEAECEVK